MSKNRFLKILLPSIALTFGTQAFAYTIQEAVSHTLATSPDFLMTTNERDMVDKELRQAYADYLPVLDMTAGWGEQYTNNPTTRGVITQPGGPTLASSLPGEGTRNLTRTEFGLRASQMLFDGFSVWNNVDGKKARVRAQSWRVNADANNRALDTIEAFLSVIFERERLQIARDNLGVLERISGQIQKRSEGGIGRKADLDQADARVALARSNVIAEEALLEEAETSFLRRVGIPVPNHLVRPEFPSSFPTSEHEAIEIGVRHHPEIRASVEDVNVVRAEHRGSRSAFWPRFDLQLAMNRNHNVDGSLGVSDDKSAMVRMNWNLFTGGKDLANICRTAYKMQDAQEVSNRSQRQTVESVRLAWNNFESNRRQLVPKRAHVVASERTSQAYHKQFNIGQRTLLDLLDSENELLQARLVYIDSKKAELLGMFQVLNATGTLNDYLGIILPRQAEIRPTGLIDGQMRFFDKNNTMFD